MNEWDQPAPQESGDEDMRPTNTRTRLDTFARRTIRRLSGRRVMGEDQLPRVPGYAPVRELGHGGFGTVFLVLSTDGAQYALKMYPADSDDVVTELTHREIPDEHVVKMYEAGPIDAHQRYVVMEFCPGGSLADQVGQKEFTPTEVAELLAQLTGGVAAIHTRGIVHRDLTPNNILFGPDGLPKITDFGLSRPRERSPHTSPSRVAFTPQYVAPERFEGGEEDARSDLYSLGAIGYALLSGSPPVGQVGRAGRRHSAPLAVSIRKLRPDVPHGLAAILHRCLSPNPDHRYPTASALTDELQRLLNGKWVLRTRLALGWRQAASHLQRFGLAYLFVAALASVGVGWGIERGDTARRETGLRQDAEREAKAADEAVEQLIEQAEKVGRYQSKLQGGLDLLTRARNHLKNRAGQMETDPRRTGEAADLYRRCGRIAFNMDDMPGAATDYDHALRFAELARQTDDAPASTLRLAGILREWGVTRYLQKKEDDAGSAWERADGLLRPLLNAGPDYRFTLGQVCMVRGNAADQVEAKRRWYTEAESLIDGVMADSPNDRRYRFALAEVLTNRAHFGHVFPDLIDPTTAEADCRRAVAIRRELVKEFPDSPQEKAYLAASLNELGNALSKRSGAETNARNRYEEAIKLYEALTTAFPGVLSNYMELMDTRKNLLQLKIP